MFLRLTYSLKQCSFFKTELLSMGVFMLTIYLKFLIHLSQNRLINHKYFYDLTQRISFLSLYEVTMWSTRD